MTRQNDLPIGVVVIGRNEGARLKRCLRSIKTKPQRIVYVDSGSTDSSIEFAKSLGMDVVSLDKSEPFTMPRGRNEGFNHLMSVYPDLDYVQFLDGDCEVVKDWLAKAYQELDKRPDVAIVCGRRRERFPDATIYNRLCDMEWDTPIGIAQACGGDAMMRTTVFQQVGGYSSEMIAGEEAELCVRIRDNGWKIFRVDAEMTIHDADITQFGQFFRRAVRSGHAYAENASKQRHKSKSHNVRILASIIFWGGVMPTIFLLCFLLSWWQPWMLLGAGLVALCYLGQRQRIYRYRHNRNDTPGLSALYATFCLIGKMPEFIGVFTFGLNHLRNQQTKLIEYKTTGPST